MSETAQRRYLWRVLREAAERLDVPLDEAAERGAVFGWRDRTIGVPVVRGGRKLWLRATGEHEDWTESDDWTGNRDAADLHGIPKPAFVDRATWREEAVVNCGELMTFVPDRPCSPTPELREEFVAPDAWWQELRKATDTLGEYSTTRGSETRGWYDPSLRVFFGERPLRLEPAWRTEHMDIQWSNLTAPQLWVLDWESWGRAPAGYGAASLYCHSLLVPRTARRVHEVFADVLDPPEGRYAQLCVIAHLLRRALGGEYGDLVLPLRELADRLLAQDG
ncbi:aminoglycoside phosphotransferase [Streptomyces mayteni]